MRFGHFNANQAHRDVNPTISHLFLRKKSFSQDVSSAAEIVGYQLVAFDGDGSMKLSANKPCPCQSGKKTKGCCAPLLKGVAAHSPEALMRSRYTAYVTGNIKYIMNTTHPDGEHHRDDEEAWHKEIEVFCREFDFHGLSVLETEVKANQGWVTFHAKIAREDKDVSFTERSLFLRESDRWLYHSAVRTTTD